MVENGGWQRSGSKGVCRYSYSRKNHFLNSSPINPQKSFILSACVHIVIVYPFPLLLDLLAALATYALLFLLILPLLLVMQNFVLDMSRRLTYNANESINNNRHMTGD